MPQLDVSFMTLDPMLADSFRVDRRQDTVGTNGRTTATPYKTWPCQRGVVTQENPADLIRNDVGQMVPRIIFIATKFALQGAIVGFQPDTVTWNGTTYTVKQVLPYSRFGAGTYEVLAEATTAMNTKQ